MRELLSKISTEVEQFLDGPCPDVYRDLSRTAIIHSNDAAIDLEQSKMPSADEVQQIQTSGPSTLPTPEWFNDVEWMQHPRESELSTRRLRLNAIYPTAYFDTDPGAGNYEKGDWLDQYGAVTGFGSKDEIKLWVLRFVDPDSGLIAQLRYPDDPTALEQYNERFKQYLHTLDKAQPTISYYRGWDRRYSHNASKTGLVLGGMSLAGFGINTVLEQGSPAIEDKADFIRVHFDYKPEKDGYVGRQIVLTGDHEATTQPFWDGEDAEEEASDELLTTALELIRNAVKVSQEA